MTRRGHHLQDERLFDCYLADRHGDAPDPPTAEHLSDCDACAARYADLARVMDTLRNEGQAEADAIWEIYSSAWSKNWGFAPLTQNEFRVLAKDMKAIIVPELALIGEVDGKPVGFALALSIGLPHSAGKSCRSNASAPSTRGSHISMATSTRY